jgi:putative phosphoribosyl transferase
MMNIPFHKKVSIPVDKVILEGELTIPENAKGIVIFSHGSGSSRLSPRNKMVAAYLQRKKFGTLLFDLLTPAEDAHYQLRFDIWLLTKRLTGVTQWLEKQSMAKEYLLGYFGASTGSASALKAAARLPQISAIVSRGGRPDLAFDMIEEVQAPTLLIVGSLDYYALRLNKEVYRQLNCEKN